MKFLLVNVLLSFFAAEARHVRGGNANLNASDAYSANSRDALDTVVDDPDMEDDDDDFVSGLEKYAGEEDLVFERTSNATIMTGQASSHWSKNSTSAMKMFGWRNIANRPSRLRGRALWPKNWRAWYQKHKGNDGPGKPSAPMWVMRSNVIRSFAVCTPPKNGCSRWKRLLRRIQGFSDYMRDPHDWRTNGLVQAGRQSVAFQRNLWTKPNIFKIMLARNPLERLLSAWLSKKKVFNLPRSFGKFTQMLDHPKWSGASVHWQFQTSLCDSPGTDIRSFHYDFIAKVEDRDIWMDKLEDFLSIKVYTSTGWGASGLQAFSEAESKIGSVDTGATKLKVLKKYYKPEIFRRVCRYYRKDIRALGYQKDIRGLWKDIFQGRRGPLHY